VGEHQNNKTCGPIRSEINLRRDLDICVHQMSKELDKSDDTFMSRYTFTFDAAMRVESQLIHLREFHMRSYLVANCSESLRAACRYSEVPLSCVRGKNT